MNKKTHRKLAIKRKKREKEQKRMGKQDEEARLRMMEEGRITRGRLATLERSQQLTRKEVETIWEEWVQRYDPKDPILRAQAVALTTDQILERSVALRRIRSSATTYSSAEAESEGSQAQSTAS